MGDAGRWGPWVPVGAPATVLWALLLWPSLDARSLDPALTLMWSLTKEALPLGQPGRRPLAPHPQPSSSLLKSERWLSTREWLRPHHRATGRCR